MFPLIEEKIHMMSEDDAPICFLHVSLMEIVNIAKFVHKIFIWVLKVFVRVHLHWNAWKESGNE